jgi:actin-related protein
MSKAAKMAWRSIKRSENVENQPWRRQSVCQRLAAAKSAKHRRSGGEERKQPEEIAIAAEENNRRRSENREAKRRHIENREGKRLKNGGEARRVAKCEETGSKRKVIFNRRKHSKRQSARRKSKAAEIIGKRENTEEIAKENLKTPGNEINVAKLEEEEMKNATQYQR